MPQLHALVPFTLLAALAGAAPAHAQGHAFAVSGSGPGEGRGAGAIAVGPLVLGGVALPAVAFDYSRGLSEHFDFITSFDAGLHFADPFAVVGVLDLGVRARVTSADAPAQFGLTLSPELMFLTGGGVVAVFGANPGVFVSAGTPSTQVTMGLDVPIYFAGALSAGQVSGAGTGLAVTLRPHLTLETEVSPTLGLFMSGAVDLAVGEASGLLYVLVTGGVTF